MKAPLFLIVLASWLPAPGAETRLDFDNGDSLAGSMVDIDERGLHWNSPAFAGPQVFRLDRVDQLTLPVSGELHLPEGNHLAVVTLTNGDELRGCLTRLTDKEVGLSTQYAGDLVLRRDMVEALRIEDRPEILYAGPEGLDGWVQSQEEGWSYEPGELVCRKTSSIGRDVGRHSKIRLRFDVEWQSNAKFSVYLHCDSEDPDDMKNGYVLVCQSQYAYMRKHLRSNPATVGSQGGIVEFSQKNKVSFEILQDLETGRVRILVDGRRIDDWTENAPGADLMGGFLHFAADRDSGIRISRIRMSTWDGQVDGEWGMDDGPVRIRMRNGLMLEDSEDAPEEPEADTSQDIRLRNGDVIVGETLGIEDGRVRLRTTYKEITLPVPRLKSFALRTAEEAADPELRWEPIRRKGDIRAHFAEGGSITFQLVGLEDGALIGRSQTFGEATFDLSAFSSLEFNIYELGL